MRPLLALIAILVVAPGCIQSANDTPAAALPTNPLPNLADAPEPAIDAARARMWWEEFVANTPYRHAGTPTNIQASEQLARDLEAAGYEAHTFYYIPPTLEGVPIPIGGPSPADAGIRTVIGIKTGHTEPQKVVSWVAHYDSNQQTIYGAYDDGSGTAVAVELARVLATYNNSKTLMPIFFDAEEMGLVASQAFVEQALGSDEYRFDMVIGHDMTGINCPGHEWPMYQMVGENYADILVPIEEALYRDVMKIDYGLEQLDTPTADIEPHCVVILNGHDRNSDERHFKEAGIPILRMAGGRKAIEYPAYHQPNDTIEYLYDFMGGTTQGPSNYEKGLDLVVRASYWNVVIFDRLPSL